MAPLPRPLCCHFPLLHHGLVVREAGAGGWRGAPVSVGPGSLSGPRTAGCGYRHTALASPLSGSSHAHSKRSQDCGETAPTQCQTFPPLPTLHRKRNNNRVG